MSFGVKCKRHQLIGKSLALSYKSKKNKRTRRLPRTYPCLGNSPTQQVLFTGPQCGIVLTGEVFAIHYVNGRAETKVYYASHRFQNAELYAEDKFGFRIDWSYKYLSDKKALKLVLGFHDELS